MSSEVSDGFQDCRGHILKCMTKVDTHPCRAAAATAAEKSIRDIGGRFQELLKAVDVSADAFKKASQSIER